MIFKILDMSTIFAETSSLLILELSLFIFLVYSSSVKQFTRDVACRMLYVFETNSKFDEVPNNLYPLPTNHSFLFIQFVLYPTSVFSLCGCTVYHILCE